MNIIYDNDLSVTDYLNLRALIGWTVLPEKQAQAGINGSSFEAWSNEKSRAIT